MEYPKMLYIYGVKCSLSGMMDYYAVEEANQIEESHDGELVGIYELKETWKFEVTKKLS